jgi:preprotein translocase subunit SecB
MNQEQQPGIELVSLFLESGHFSHAVNPMEPLPEDIRGIANATVGVTLFEGRENTRAIRLSISNDSHTKGRYLFSVDIVAEFRVIQGHENMPLDEYVATNGAALLFPFAREAIANLTSRGRFGPIWLNPANLFALAQQGKQLAEQEQHPINSNKDAPAKSKRKKPDSK